MNHVDTTPDLLLIALVGGAVAVCVAAVFWFLGSRHPRVVIGTLVAFGVAVVVVFAVRMASVEQHHRAEAQARLDALGQSLQERTLREAEDRQRLAALQQHDVVPDNEADRQTASSASDRTNISAAWLPEVDEQFEADVYPSANLAGRALMRSSEIQVFWRLYNSLPEPTAIRLVRANEFRAVQQAMGDELRQRFPNAKVVVDPLYSRADLANISEEGELIVELRVPRTATRKRIEDGVDFQGTISAVLRGRAGELSLSAKYIEKPWLARTSEFLSEHNNRTSYRIVFSNKLTASREGATRDVLGQAANLLGHLIDPRENQGLPRTASAMMLEQLEAGNYIADRFVQKLKRPYGDVYREAVLLDVGSSNLREMIEVTMSEASTHQAATERRSATQISGVLGLLVVVGALTGLYLLLNWLTKGYYRGPLTVALCVAGSGAIVGAIMLIGVIV